MEEIASALSLSPTYPQVSTGIHMYPHATGQLISVTTTRSSRAAIAANERVWLSNGVAVLLSIDHYGFPADNNVLGNGEDTIGEQWPERSVKP
jgi:hypothetical protein